MSSILTSTALFIIGSLCLVVGFAAIVLAGRILRSALRSERMGKERLEILRDQQERLELLREERRMLLEQMRGSVPEVPSWSELWRKSLVEQENT